MYDVRHAAPAESPSCLRYHWTLWGRFRREKWIKRPRKFSCGKTTSLQKRVSVYTNCIVFNTWLLQTHLGIWGLGIIHPGNMDILKVCFHLFYPFRGCLWLGSPEKIPNARKDVSNAWHIIQDIWPWLNQSQQIWPHRFHPVRFKILQKYVRRYHFSRDLTHVSLSYYDFLETSSDPATASVKRQCALFFLCLRNVARCFQIRHIRTTKAPEAWQHDEDHHHHHHHHHHHRKQRSSSKHPTGKKKKVPRSPFSCTGNASLTSACIPGQLPFTICLTAFKRLAAIQLQWATHRPICNQFHL